jgi:uncharacterized membrane protein YkvA (DUF1232 family)/AraC-like DNA-binding protein
MLLRGVFPLIASDQLASKRISPALDDRARRRIWQELYEGLYGSFDCVLAANPRFSVHTKIVRFGPVLVDEFKGTIIRTTQDTRKTVAHGDDGFFLGLNCGPQPLSHNQRGKEAVHVPGSLVLFSNADPGVMRNDPRNLWLSVHVPKGRLLDLIANAEDLVARRINEDQPGVRFLRSYLRLLLDVDIAAGDRQFEEHIGQTLIDLVALCLGAKGDPAELAKCRGLKFARLRAVKAEISAGFSRPEFSVDQIAMNLGVTPRYVQELLHESGETFTDRVLELRLQKARTMLASRSCDHLRIIEIAFACGFNEVSHFNRCFRRRFGDTPSSYRGEGTTPPLQASVASAKIRRTAAPRLLTRRTANNSRPNSFGKSLSVLTSICWVMKYAAFGQEISSHPFQECRRTTHRDFWAKLKQFAGQMPFVEDFVTAYHCAMDTATPMRVRGILLATLAYFIVPYDLIPDVTPAIGFTDDAALLVSVIGRVSSHITPVHRTTAATALQKCLPHR